MAAARRPVPLEVHPEECPHRRAGHTPEAGGQLRGRGHRTIVRGRFPQDNQVSALRDAREMSGRLAGPRQRAARVRTIASRRDQNHPPGSRTKRENHVDHEFARGDDDVAEAEESYRDVG
ncbi:hypothetical protein GCM10009609_73460 [Pseudonocardia aurantiaca]